MVDNNDDDNDDGAWVYYKLTYGSGELKIQKIMN